MLTLTRKIGERIEIGGLIQISVLSVSRGRVRIGVHAPKEFSVYRGELVDKIQSENQRAQAGAVQIREADEHALAFPAGLLGMQEHTSFVLCETDEGHDVRALVSRVDPQIQLLVIEARLVFEGYPIEEAQQIAGLDDEEVAVAAVITAPPNAPATVNLAAPIVLGLNSREGKQVILDRRELGVRHTLVAQGLGGLVAQPASPAA
ncbi:MAG: carbon storage regulator CsrA [Myxococcota bacterium]